MRFLILLLFVLSLPLVGCAPETFPEDEKNEDYRQYEEDLFDAAGAAEDAAEDADNSAEDADNAADVAQDAANNAADAANNAADAAQLKPTPPPTTPTPTPTTPTPTTVTTTVLVATGDDPCAKYQGPCRTNEECANKYNLCLVPKKPPHTRELVTTCRKEQAEIAFITKEYSGTPGTNSLLCDLIENDGIDRFLLGFATSNRGYCEVSRQKQIAFYRAEGYVCQ